MQIDGLPDSPLPVPPRVESLASGRPVAPVWRNALGGLTFRIGDGDSDGDGAVFVKWAPLGSGLDLRGEIARLAWAGQYTPVPHVMEHGSDDDGAWMVTRAMPGRSAVDPRWHDDPRVAVLAAGAGLRALHDALPVADCPFEWSIPMRIARSGATQQMVDELGPAPELGDVVVCHGDPCTPNTLLDDDGRWIGHVDMDVLGIADRWADISVATMALGWNFGPGWDQVFLDAYGVALDAERSRWYRALWNLGDEPPLDQLPGAAPASLLHP